MKLSGRTKIWSVAAAVIAALSIAIGSRRHQTDSLVEAAEALRYRVSEARLTGGFPYRPLPQATRGSGDEARETPNALFAIASQARAGDLRSAGRSSHVLAMWTDAAYALDEALRRATQREQLADALAASRDADLLTDLSAAHHDAARHSNEAHHYVIAAEAAERAWRIAKTPETAWNRALAIESLHLRRQARIAWRDYLVLDPDSPWAREVRERIRALGAMTDSGRWEQVQPELARAVALGDRRTIERIVRAFPGTARHTCEQIILPAWAKRGDEQSLALCRAVGEVLHRSSGESLLYDTIAAIDAAGPRERKEIIEALAVYRDAAVSGSQRKVSDACRQFAAAMPVLRAHGVALAAKAQMYLTDCKRFDTGGDVSFDERRYPSLVAQMAWIRGLANVRTGRPQAAIEAYEKALSTYTALGERESIAAIKLMLAEAKQYVGDPGDAWRLYVSSLEDLASSGSTQAQMLEVLFNSGKFAQSEGLPLASLLFLDEHLLEPKTVVETRFRMLLFRALLYGELGNQRAAAVDVGAARALVPKIPDAAVRADRMRAPDVVRSRLAETRDAAGREQILRDAVDYAREKKFTFRLSQLYLDEGLEHVRAGRLDAAKTTLYEAVAQIEAEREHVTDQDRRGMLVAARQAIYGALITVLCRRGEYGEAFDVVERGRARSLMDGVANGAQPLRELRRVGAIAASLPKNTALVELAQVGDTLLTWIIAADGVRVIGRRVDADALQRRVDQIRLAGRDRDEASARDSAAALYDMLVRPWRVHVRGYQRLVFVPDETLAGIPFGAFLDRSTGRFLVLDHIVSNAPSANVFAACLARDRERAQRQGPTLVVAPATSYASAGGEVLLAATRTEADRVAQQYERAEVLSGAMATSANFLQQAPRARYIHFGGHGAAVRGGVPRLLFAARADGSADALDVEDIRTMRLDNVRVVVLASCISGTDQPGAMQSTSSLARAFLAAGAPAVVATYWNVDDEAAAELSRRLHEQLARGAEPSAALCLAQRQMLAARDAKSAEIGSWAAFAVHGGTQNFLEER